MIVSCSSCGAKYRYDDNRFAGKSTARIRCTKCENIFEITNPTPGAAAEMPSPLAVGKSVTTGDQTYRRRTEPGIDGGSPVEQTREHDLSRVASSSPSRLANLRLPAAKKLSVAAISGADSGKTFPIAKPRVIIGRTGADISLSDAEISRHHAAIEIEDDDIRLVDLDSTNGTFLGGQRVQEAQLDNYSEFEVGGTTLMLIITGI